MRILLYYIYIYMKNLKIENGKLCLYKLFKLGDFFFFNLKIETH